MSATRTASTLTGQAHERIRADILSGRLAHGQPLRLVALATQFGVSMSVVREALTRLSEQGLVIASPNQGFRVIPLSKEDLADLTQLRVTLECSALEKSIAQGDVRWEGEVVSTHHILERTPLPSTDSPDEREEWIRAHAAFHDALSAACGSPRLLGLVRSLRDGAEVYRQWSGSVTGENQRDVAGEHRTLMDLATARHSVKACAALREHIEVTTQILLNGPDADAGSSGR